jgi:Metallo-peptidase family M12/Bacterial pre-peptidase C-terminal domain
VTDLKIYSYIRSKIVVIAIATYFAFSSSVFAGDPAQLIGKDLAHNRDLLISAMQGRNYVVEVNQQGKIKQVVDAGAKGDGTEAQQTEKNSSHLGTQSTVTSIELPENYQGQTAIDYMGIDLPKIAAGYGLTPDKLEELLLTDDTIRIDSNNRVFFIDNRVEQQASIVSSAAETTSGSASDNSSVPMASTEKLANAFKLHSKPGASKTIYLDFDGHTASGTAWSSSTIIAPAYDLSGNPAAFDNNELSNIISIWNRVSEDYMPFDVDVTTEPPSADALLRTSAADISYGVRVVITKTGIISCTCSGLAYVGVVSMVNNAAYQPVWIFQQSLANNEKYIAESIAHETGHTLGLFHDGQNTGSTVTSYYEGHGTGTTGWAPIMGASYYKNITQFSNGAYPGANNQQDDVAVLASNGILPRTDLVGNTFATASYFTNLETGATVNVQPSGVIETSTDVDMYMVNAAGGAVNLAVSPAATGPNLDIKLTLYKSDGTIVTTNAPEAELSAVINTFLPAGTYFLAVSGSAHGQSGADYGYPTQGSLGQYQITGSFAAGIISMPKTEAIAKPNIPIALAPIGPTVHAAQVRMNVKRGGKVNARVLIKVVNDQGIAIPNAVVKGIWSGTFAGRLNGRTAKNGIVAHSPNARPSRKGASCTFTINNIIAPGYVYNPSQNDKTVATVAW